MAVNFPDSPSNGATHTVGSITYVYDSAKGVWKDSPAGLTQGIDALTDVDISTSAPTNGQILQYNSTSGKFVPADSSAGVTVYATINDLPLTGVTEGSMALVDSTDKLYIYSDTGWYSIALVNTSPSISGVNASYNLETDGSATTITVTASDPEGIPLTYSIVSDTSGNIATVAQGTGSNTNQWTITPSTNTAHAGNFTLVFRASDGTNVASASSTFTLAFAYVDSKYTTMLLTSVGANNGVNNSYTDSSASAHTITRNGETNQVAYSPYRHGGYSTYFNGNGDYLAVASSADFNVSSGAWTAEAWVYSTGWTTPISQHVFSSFASSTNRSSLYYNSTAAEITYWSNGSPRIEGGSLNANQWYHIALVSDGTTTTLYVDGSSAGTTTHTQHDSNMAIYVGTAWNGAGETSGYMDGYISDFRFVKGTAITPSSGGPTERLTAVTNTKLLTCHLPYFADGSTNDHAITFSAIDGPSQEPFAPYDNSGYVSSDHGGSAFFDGNGDYLSIADSEDFNMGTGDYTIEFWYNHFTRPGNYPSAVATQNWTGSEGLAIRYDNSTTANKVAFFWKGTGDPWITSTNTFPTLTWMHIALVRSGTSFKLYVNGKEEASGTNSSANDWSTGGSFRVGWGQWDGANGYINANISDLRVVKGTAVYTGAFTPPTGPLTQTGGTYSSTTNVNTSITSGHTKLLLPCDDASIIDKSQSIKDIRVAGSLVSSNAVTKFGSTSIKYNGSDARAFLRSGNLFNLGTGEFTVECWLYKDATGTGMILDARPSDTGAPWLLGVSTSEYVFFYDGSSYTASVALSQNTWTHIAVTRDSSNVLRIFLDGTVRHTTNSYTTNLTATDQTVTGVNAGYPSDYISGYIEDLRVTKGKARYTANFTAPTAALGG